MRLLWNESSLSGCKCPSEHIKGIWILVSRSFKLCEHSEETSKKPAKGERETKGRSVNALLMHPGHGQDFSLWEFCHAQLSSTETSPRKDFLQESLDLFFEETHCSFTAKPRSSWGFACPFCSVSPISPQQSPSAFLERIPLPAVRGEQGCPVTCPVYTYFSLLIFLLIVPSAIPGSSNLPVVMRSPVPSTALQVPPTRAPNEGTTGLADTSCLFCFFFFPPFSHHHSKLK